MTCTQQQRAAAAKEIQHRTSAVTTIAAFSSHVNEKKNSDRQGYMVQHVC
jgi:hypothetical protein